ncbi:MAG: class I SAM-dependent methyltransferase [Rhodanobacter sp.]
MAATLLGKLGRWFGASLPDAPRHGLVGRPDLWQMKRAFQIDFLRRRGLQPTHRVLDIGCGSLRGGAALIAYLEPQGYCGIDVRESVLAEARRELRREKLSAKLPRLVLASDMAPLDLQSRFDVLWAFSVLFHLADPILDACLLMAARHLEPKGVFFANVILGDGLPGEWQGFPVVPRTLEAYRILALRHGLHTCVLGTLAELGHRCGDPSQDEQCMLAFSSNPDNVARSLCR